MQLVLTSPFGVIATLTISEDGRVIPDVANDELDGAVALAEENRFQGGHPGWIQAVDFLTEWARARNIRVDVVDEFELQPIPDGAVD